MHAWSVLVEQSQRHTAFCETNADGTNSPDLQQLGRRLRSGVATTEEEAAALREGERAGVARFWPFLYPRASGMA